MSNLNQAKSEAERLFHIAKSNNLNINSLNESQKILAIMNGYKDWYDFEIALQKKDALIHKKEQNTIHQYLTNEDKYNLQKYYIDNCVFNKKVFIDHIYQHNTTNYKFISSKELILGIKVEKNKKLFSKDIEITFSPRNIALWGIYSKNVAKEILKKFMNSNACVNISYSDSMNSIIYQNMNFDENILKKLLLLNLNINASFTHSIDPINPFIIFKNEFLNLFQLPEKQSITDIFYSLCLYFHEKKYALTSKELQCFLSLKWIANFNEDEKIKNIISTYLMTLNISNEDINDECFFENKNQEIQSHHLLISKTQKILDTIAKFEAKNIFSPEAQIDFDDIFYNRKVLLINHQYSSDNEVKAISNIINCLFLKKLEQYNKYYNNSIPKNKNEVGSFNCFTLIDNMELFLNDETYPLTLICSNSIDESIYTSPFIFTFDSFKSLNIKYENILMNTFQHIFLKMDDISIPKIIAQKILSYCSDIPKNLFNEYHSPIKYLKYYECYFMKKYEEKIEDYEKEPAGSLKNRYEIVHIKKIHHKNFSIKDICFNSFHNIRKLKE